MVNAILADLAASMPHLFFLVANAILADLPYLSLLMANAIPEDLAGSMPYSFLLVANAILADLAG